MSPPVRSALFAASITGLSYGCAGPKSAPPQAVTTSALTSTTELAIEACVGGVPVKTRDHGPTTIVVREEYALEHSTTHKVALWVCEEVEPFELRGPGDREDSRFRPDPLLRPGERAELDDYRGSGFDRSHQAPAADFKYTQDRMDDSFYLSNVAPQVGIGFNRDIWRDLEAHVRDVALEHGGAFVISGGYFDGPFETVGDNEVGVPTHFYKIIVVEDDDGAMRAMAFVLENRRHSGEDFEDFVVPIDDIEAAAGLDFLPRLPAADQARLESSVGELP